MKNIQISIKITGECEKCGKQVERIFSLKKYLELIGNTPLQSISGGEAALRMNHDYSCKG